MKFPRGAKIFTGQFDPLPYVGVFLCLIIFILLFQSMVLPRGVVVELPDLPGSEPVTQGRFRVVIDNKGRYFFENRIWLQQDLEITLSERLTALKQAATNTTETVSYTNLESIVLEADRNLEYQTLGEAMNVFRRAGFRKVIQIGRSTAPPTSDIFNSQGTADTSNQE